MALFGNHFHVNRVRLSGRIPASISPWISNCDNPDNGSVHGSEKGKIFYYCGKKKKVEITIMFSALIHYLADKVAGVKHTSSSQIDFEYGKLNWKQGVINNKRSDLNPT